MVLEVVCWNRTTLKKTRLTRLQTSHTILQKIKLHNLLDRPSAESNLSSKGHAYNKFIILWTFISWVITLAPFSFLFLLRVAEVWKVLCGWWPHSRQGPIPNTLPLAPMSADLSTPWSAWQSGHTSFTASHRPTTRLLLWRKRTKQTWEYAKSWVDKIKTWGIVCSTEMTTMESAITKIIHSNVASVMAKVHYGKWTTYGKKITGSQVSENNTKNSTILKICICSD